jgi:hypothetical protein
VKNKQKYKTPIGNKLKRRCEEQPKLPKYKITDAREGGDSIGVSRIKCEWSIYPFSTCIFKRGWVIKL